MTTLKTYIKHHFSIPNQELEYIIDQFTPVSLRKNTFFLNAGDLCRKLAFVDSGVMRNFSIDQEGREVVKYMTSDGDFNTVYQYFINQEACPEFIQCVTDCELEVIGNTDFLALKERSKIFSDLIDKLVLDGLACKEHRLKSYLEDNARKRYENLLIEQPKVVQFSPMQDIASYLGITRETLSRIRNQKVPAN